MVITSESRLPQIGSVVTAVIDGIPSPWNIASGDSLLWGSAYRWLLEAIPFSPIGFLQG